MKNKTCDKCHRIFKSKTLREAHGQCDGVRKRADISITGELFPLHTDMEICDLCYYDQYVYLHITKTINYQEANT
jgi:hypothetical protein